MKIICFPQKFHGSIPSLQPSKTLVFLISDDRWSNLRHYLIERRLGKNGSGFLFAFLINLICPGVLRVRNLILP